MIDFRQGRGVKTIEPSRPVDANTHQASFAQRLEMLGDVRLRQAERFHGRPRRPFAIAEKS